MIKTNNPGAGTDKAPNSSATFQSRVMIWTSTSPSSVGGCWAGGSSGEPVVLVCFLQVRDTDGEFHSSTSECPRASIVSPPAVHGAETVDATARRPLRAGRWNIPSRHLYRRRGGGDGRSILLVLWLGTKALFSW
jgi:hypothetical protein